tara:strand:- start:2862 stop:3149 length:288 start_codon:yes stop_codon:yes gene_type:complete
MNKEEIKEFVNELGVLNFGFCSDNIIEYKTPITKIINNELCFYRVSFFIEKGSTFFNYDSVNDFLGGLQIFEVTLIGVIDGRVIEEIYFSQYESN